MQNKIKIENIIKELENFFSREDLDGAGKHLEESLKTAKIQSDWQCELSILNEQIGYFRRVGKKGQALEAVEKSFEMIEKHKIQTAISAATIWLNGATTLKAFGKPADSIPYFKKVSKVYEEKLDKNDYRYASLFNNMSLSYVDLKEFDMALKYYKKAIEIMNFREAYIELAVTYTNMAQMYEKWTGDENQISDSLMMALEYLNNSQIEWNGYYAFNCRKCAPTFGYYGFFLVEKELNERSDKIYAGN